MAIVSRIVVMFGAFAVAAAASFAVAVVVA